MVKVAAMKAIIQTDPDNPRALEWGDAPKPEIGDGEVLVKVRAAAVNRADILQARGHYPPPKGVTDILGLECAGVIEEVGENSAGWQVGDEVCCLLSGGGFAEYAAVPVGQLLPVRDLGLEMRDMPLDNGERIGTLFVQQPANRVEREPEGP